MKHARARMLRNVSLSSGLVTLIFSSLVIASCGDSDSNGRSAETPTGTATGTPTHTQTVTPTQTPTATSTADPQEVAEQAYIFAYPMIENYKTMYLQAVAPPPPDALPFNTYHHNTTLVDSTFTDVVRPNNDTLYSIAWLDLRAEPMVIHVPAITDRYYSFQLVDMYTFNFDYIGTRATGTDAGDYLIAGPFWDGPTPDGIDESHVFRSEGVYVYSLTRTGVDGQTDIPNVEAIQQQYGLQPLSAFLGEPPPSPVPDDTFPAYDPNSAVSADFIGYFNWLLGRVTIDPYDQPMIDGFRSIGIGPNLPFDSATLDPATLAAINFGVTSALQQIEEEGKNLGALQNGWNLIGRVFGDREQMQGQYLTRAAAAYVGLYGNDLEEAYYPSTFLDLSGDPINGQLDASKHNYVLRFPADQIPNVQEQNHGFWSITMYNTDQLLVTNDLGRYSIGNRTDGLQYDSGDGSLELYLQFADPEPDKKSNWLPAPNGPFSLTLRMYLPASSAIGDPLWAPPGIQATDLGTP
jgi:hypothetical protein